jgi:hypothetical protein
MHTDFTHLQVTTEALEDLTDLSTLDYLAIAAYQGIVLKQPKALFSFLLMEIFWLGLTLILVLPVSLLLLRYAERLPEAPDAIAHLILSLVGVSLLMVMIGNSYLWKRIKQLKRLASLLIEVEKFNAVIHDISLLDQLASAEPRVPFLPDRQAAIEMLQITREGLIHALQVDKLFRQKGLLNRRHELVASLENNLTTLMSLDLATEADDYGRFLNQAMDIGLSVHREMRLP